MASDPAIAAQAFSAGPQADLSTSGDQCNPLRGSNRMPVANASRRFPQLEYGLRHLLEMEKRRRLGDNTRCVASQGATSRGEEIDANCGNYRQDEFYI